MDDEQTWCEKLSYFLIGLLVITWTVFICEVYDDGISWTTLKSSVIVTLKLIIAYFINVAILWFIGSILSVVFRIIDCCCYRLFPLPPYVQHIYAPNDYDTPNIHDIQEMREEQPIVIESRP